MAKGLPLFAIQEFLRLGKKGPHLRCWLNNCAVILIIIAAFIIAISPAMVNGMCFSVQPSLAIVANALFLASTLVASRPQLLRRRRATIVLLVVLLALARSHAVALF